MSLHFEDLAVGMRFDTPGRTITEADLVNFAGVSGDYNPLHTDEEFARTTMFGRRVAHGSLVLSLTAGLRQRTGVFEGTLLALLEIRSWRFLKPVFIGDTVRVTTTIQDVRETSNSQRGVIVQRIDVVNQRGETVQQGELVSLIRRRQGSGTRSRPGRIKENNGDEENT
ncbi:MAG: MaoC/PaaZ C-terminal domain-containing protein [bacterium]